MSLRVRLNRIESKYLGHSPLVNAGKGSWTIQPNPRIDEGTGFECLLHLPIDSMSSCSLQELFVFGLGIVTSFPIYTSSILQRSRKARVVLLRRGRCLQESGTWSSGRRSSGICNIWQRLLRGPAGSSKRMGLSAAKETAGNSFTWLNSLKTTTQINTAEQWLLWPCKQSLNDLITHSTGKATDLNISQYSEKYIFIPTVIKKLHDF